MNGLEIMYLVVFSIMASSFSSFLIASDFRGWKNLSKPSSCDNCGHKISAFALIPVFGALFSNFTCKHCNQKFSAKMAIMEASAALFFIGLYLFANKINFITEADQLNNLLFFGKLLFLAFISGLFSLIAFEDWNNHYISDIYMLVLVACLTYFNLDNLSMFAYYLAAAFMFKIIADNVFFYLMDKEEALGGGDIMLFAIMAYFFGPLTISHFFILMSLFAIIMTKFSKEEGLAPLAPNAFWAATVLLFIQNLF